MSNDSHLFKDSSNKDLLPLYEAKMIHQFDHRWSTYRFENGKAIASEISLTEKQQPDFCITPRYWVDKAEVEQRLRDKDWQRGWFLGWRDVCRNTDIRTLICSVIPVSAIDGGFPCVLSVLKPNKIAALLGNLNTLVVDFITRQKVSGAHLKYFHFKQIPALQPDFYTEADLNFIVPRILELTYTAHELQLWAQDLGYHGSPFVFDSDRRIQLLAELDAWFALAYGLTHDELRYILDPAEVMGDDYPSETFRVLKNNELKVFGEYRTRRLVLEAWNKLETGGFA